MAGSDARGLPQVRQHEKNLYLQDSQHTEFKILNPQTEVTLYRIFLNLIPDFLTAYAGILTAYVTHESLVGSNMATSADTTVSSDIGFFLIRSSCGG